MPGKPAARIADLSVHGGTVVSGSPNVIICSMLASRQGDAHVCPIPGHGPGKIVGCSATVIINKRGAARMGDFIACATPASPPSPGSNPSAGEYKPTAADDTTKGMQPKGAEEKLHKVAAEYKVKNDENYQKVLYAEAKFSDTDKDGTRDAVKAGAGVANLSGRVQQKDGNFGAAGQVKLLTVEGEAKAYGTNRGGTVAANAKAEGETVAGSVFVGPKGDNGKNPYFELGARGTAGVAEVGGEAFVGDDGKRQGFLLGGKAGASALDGEVNARTAIPTGKGNTLDIKAAASAGLGSTPGGEVRLGFYKDKEEGRWHFVGGLAGSFLGKIGISWDISWGKRYKQDDAGNGSGADAKKGDGKDASGGSGGTPSPGPNAVALGCFTVFIGG
jgi:uncharacterized Zn-binding protein involved in type VI secretion